jgi:hypothetical protein
LAAQLPHDRTKGEATVNEEQPKPDDNTTKETVLSSPASPPPAADNYAGLSWRQRLSPLWFLAYQFVLLLVAYNFELGSLTMGLLQTGGLCFLCVHFVWLTAQDRPTPQRAAYLKVFLASAIVLGIIAACYVYIIAQQAQRQP